MNRAVAVVTEIRFLQAVIGDARSAMLNGVVKMPSEKQIEAAHEAANKVANNHTYVSETSIIAALTAAEQAEPAPAALSGAVKVKALMCDFEDFINQPPQYEDQRMVRDYRHELYRKWEPLCRLILTAALKPAEPAADAEPGTDTLYGAPPQDVIDAARKVEHYFASKGISEWELCGVASRHHTRPPESRLREALEKIARGLSLTFTSSPTKMSGNEAQEIARDALAQEDGR